MQIVIFGANGPTGRLLTQHSLSAGHQTVAVTRKPAGFPLQDPSLRVVGGDVLDQEAVDHAVRGSDVVLSTLGAPFSKAVVEVYSGGAEHLLNAMNHNHIQRLVVVSSGAVTGSDEPTGGFLFNRILQPYIMTKLGKTVYDDMRRMEDLITRSDTEWTILRPSGLFTLPAITDYSLTEEHGPGRFTARIDLADAMLRQVDDRRFVRKIGHVITTRDNPNLLTMTLREARNR